jgi:hypothetical protein
MSRKNQERLLDAQQYEELARLIQCCNFKLLRCSDDSLPAFGIIREES